MKIFTYSLTTKLKFLSFWSTTNSVPNGQFVRIKIAKSQETMFYQYGMGVYSTNATALVPLDGLQKATYSILNQGQNSQLSKFYLLSGYIVIILTWKMFKRTLELQEGI